MPGKDKKKKILIAEDEKPMANALKAKLENSGFEVSLAFNGQEALQILQQEKIDLLLLDLIMPQKDGFAVLAELKKIGSKVQVVISSNLSQADDISRAKELGAADFFVKSNTQIVAVVEKVKKVLKL